MHRPDSTGKREKLTTRQREVLQTAYFIGFFEQPRVRTGTEIADAMGISQPTFKQVARRIPRPTVGGEEADTCCQFRSLKVLASRINGVVGGQQLSLGMGRSQPAPKSGMPTRERPKALRVRRGESTDKPRAAVLGAVDRTPPRGATQILSTTLRVADWRTHPDSI
ncbi:helix-turn-helix domain-containing protein [Halospeciosus flavus]|uniref:helix-turn-helix domain-containing protein n=1 Tax=Halospeciosus flavus TaxID=3032283 RepID=UPI00360DC5E4